ncbi:MAG TPA: hypothetical protein DDZ88_25055 [Verrucomicrobiales bacterium]|nr:hypothetical protein [Verrucomicrobiales bacterium]
MIATNTTCPQCGASLDTRRTGGLCPACLLLSAADEEPVEATLGRLAGHELIEVLARGGMGIVYRARQCDPEREVALKALPGAELLSEEARQRFKIEAEAMARLDHPAILPIYELGEEDGTPFFTMKLARGGSLAARMESYRGKWREIAELIAQIAEAAHYAHERGVLHRDLKPGNILFDENGQILVSDFGLAKITGDESDLTRTIALMGTPNYLAPELTRGGKGAATNACDVWSLGVMLYELLAGQTPFRGDNLATVLRQLNEEATPPLPREVPRDLGVIAHKALQKAPAQRYASALALADDLRRWLRGDPIHAHPASPAEQVVLWARRRPTLAGMAAALVVVLAVSSVLLLRANRRLAASLHAETAALDTAEDRLHAAWVAEARALLRGHELTAREETLAVVRELAAAGHRTVETRSLAARALATPGIGAGRKLQTGFAKGSSSMSVAPDLSSYVSGGGSTGTYFTIRPLSRGGSAKQVRTPAVPNNFLHSQDGRWLAVHLRDHSVQVHSLAAPEEDVFRIARSSKRWGMAVDFLPDGGAWLYADGSAALRRHDAAVAGAAEDAVVFTAPAAVTGLALSPDGTRVCVQWSGGWGVADLASGRLLWQRAETSTLARPVWHGSGELVGNAVEGPHRFLFVDAATGAETTAFFGSQGAISHAVLHPAQPLLFTLGWDRQLVLWDAGSGQAVGRLPAMVRGLVLSRDGGHLAFAPEYLGTTLYDLAVPRVWRRWEAPLIADAGGTGIDVSPDGCWLVTNTTGLARLWEIGTRRHLADVPMTGPRVDGASYWLDGGALLHGVTGKAGPRQTGHRLDVNALLEGNKDAFIPKETAVTTGGPRQRMADRRGIVMQGTDKTGAILQPDGRERVRWGPWNALDASSDGQWLAAEGGREGGYMVRRAADGGIVLRIATKAWVNMAFSPDSRHLVTAGSQEVIVHECGTWREVARWPVGVGFQGIGWAEFSPDGRYLATAQAEGTLALHETEHWTPLVHLRPPGPAYLHSGSIRFQWTADSRRLLTLTHGHRVSEWDIAALREELDKLGLGW